ncbi:MAG TPA: CoA-binding protein [Verrucomicrobiota bacterium]|nr:CoA-binding protein [Verrucomicrobiota bacterium]
MKPRRERHRPCAETLASELSAAELERLTGVIRGLRAEGVTGEHIEIGTAAGGTLVQMLRACTDAPPPFRVVDPMNYFAGQHAAVQENLRRHGLAAAPVRFMVMRSDRALRELAAHPPRAAFLFIDANHELHGVTRDLRWTRFLLPRGIVCLHDYAPGDPLCGVTLAADRFLARHPHFVREAQTGSLLVLRKTADASRPEVSWPEVLRADVLRHAIKPRRSIRKRRSRRRPEDAPRRSPMSTVAIPGASGDPAKYGHRAVLAFAVRGWRVFPVNPRGGEIAGLPVFRSLREVPERPDVVSLYVPPPVAIALLPDIAARGCGELWLNPGVDAPEVIAAAVAAGLKVKIQCSLVALAPGGKAEAAANDGNTG